MTTSKTIILASAVLVLTRCLNLFSLGFKLGAPSCVYNQPTQKSSFHQQFKRRRKGIVQLFAVTKKTNEAVETRAAQTNRNEELFQQRLSELRNFRSQHGHGSIPTPYPPNPSLGIWAANLRRQHRLWKEAEERGAPYIGYLTSERRRQLLTEGFDFTSLTERQFHTRLQELEMFKAQYGHCMVPEKWEENLALGAWVSNLRSLYRRKRMMEQQQQQQQQSLPLHQDDGEEANMIDNTNHNDHHKNNGKRKQQRRGKNWLLQLQPLPRKKRQRSPRFSHLDEDRIKLLEDMEFVWSSKDRKWLEMLEWVKVYGVVNYQLKLLSSSSGDGLEDVAYDVDSLMEGGHGNNITIPLEPNGAAAVEDQHIGQNNTLLLLDNYRKFVHNIQDQSLLPSFHLQDDILALLSEENYAQNALLGQQQSHVQPTSTQSNNEFQPSFLDYRIPPNDTLHQPLRIWMFNQRSNYNRLHPHLNNKTQDENVSLIPSTMTAQRQQALEEIHFPWSGRFGNRIEELQYEADQLAERERQLEKERRMEQKEREEREKVEQLTSSIVASVVSGGGEDSRDDGVAEEEADVDIMALWDAEGDDDDDW
ncbi:hypothetical protein ACHAXR_011452 [Thalassiosira sp. AJA248-18]